MKTLENYQTDHSPRRLRTALIAACMVIGVSFSSAQAGDRRVATERITEYAKVIDVQPVYREVRVRKPRQECWTEEQSHVIGYESAGVQRYPSHERRSAGNALVGGLIGGVIGNQLGRGHSRGSRAGATVAGAIIGSAIGNEAHAGVSRHRNHRPSRPVVETRPVERCRRVVESSYQQELQHYNVTYRYKGRTYTTQMNRDPGDRIELQVSVRPARR